MKIIPSLILSIFAVSIAGTYPAHAQSYDKSAKKACKRDMRSNYRADGFTGITVGFIKPGVYKVQGYAERSGRRNTYFSCKVKNGRVKKMNFEGWKGHSSRSDSDAGAAIVGAILGAAIIGATSKHHNHDYDRNYPAKKPINSNKWRKSYSPKPGITCYRGQRACYKSGKGYNLKWTQREFG